MTALSWFHSSAIGLSAEFLEIQRLYNLAKGNHYSFTVFYVNSEVLDGLNELLTSDDWKNEPYLQNHVVITFDFENPTTLSIPPIGFERNIINGLERFLVRVFGNAKNWTETTLNAFPKEKHLFIVYSVVNDHRNIELIIGVLNQLVKSLQPVVIQAFDNGGQGIEIPMKNPTSFVSDGSTLTMLNINDLTDIEQNPTFVAAVQASTSVTVFTMDSLEKYPTYGQAGPLSEDEETLASAPGQQIGQSVFLVQNQSVKWVSYGVFLVSKSAITQKIELPLDNFDSPVFFASFRDDALKSLRAAISVTLRFSAVYSDFNNRNLAVFWIDVFDLNPDGIYTTTLGEFNLFRRQASNRIELPEAGSSSSSSSKDKKTKPANAPERKAPARIATAYPVELRSDTQTRLVPQEYEFLNNALTTIKRDDGQNTDEWIQLATRALDFMLHPRVPVRIQEPPSKDEV